MKRNKQKCFILRAAVFALTDVKYCSCVCRMFSKTMQVGCVCIKLYLFLCFYLLYPYIHCSTALLLSLVLFIQGGIMVHLCASRRGEIGDNMEGGKEII